MNNCLQPSSSNLTIGYALGLNPVRLAKLQRPHVSRNIVTAIIAAIMSLYSLYANCGQADSGSAQNHSALDIYYYRIYRLDTEFGEKSDMQLAPAVDTSSMRAIERFKKTKEEFLNMIADFVVLNNLRPVIEGLIQPRNSLSLDKHIALLIEKDLRERSNLPRLPPIIRIKWLRSRNLLPSGNV